MEEDEDDEEELDEVEELLVESLEGLLALLAGGGFTDPESEINSHILMLTFFFFLQDDSPVGSFPLETFLPLVESFPDFEPD